jgi:hypothetical protein
MSLSAVLRSQESPWDTGAFAPRGSLSAVEEPIHRADLPEPRHANMMRIHTRTV